MDFSAVSTAKFMASAQYPDRAFTISEPLNQSIYVYGENRINSPMDRFCRLWNWEIFVGQADTMDKGESSNKCPNTPWDRSQHACAPFFGNHKPSWMKYYIGNLPQFLTIYFKIWYFLSSIPCGQKPIQNTLQKCLLRIFKAQTFQLSFCRLPCIFWPDPWLQNYLRLFISLFLIPCSVCRKIIFCHIKGRRCSSFYVLRDCLVLIFCDLPCGCCCCCCCCCCCIFQLKEIAWKPGFSRKKNLNCLKYLVGETKIIVWNIFF